VVLELKVVRLAILAAALAARPAIAGSDPGYRTVQSIGATGGSIQILEDARLTPALARKLWETAVDPIFVLGENAPEAQTFKARPPRPAKLRQVDHGGAVIQDIVLDNQAPIARIEPDRLAGPIYLVTTDNNAGFGSYSGLVTTLYKFRSGRLEPVRALASDQHAEAVVLVDTLKSGWKIIDHSPTHAVIEQLLCRPDLDHNKPGEEARFQLTYITYWSDGRDWRVAKRVTPGFWENEGDWPAASNFPKAGGR